jgi:hypothetical protein
MSTKTHVMPTDANGLGIILGMHLHCQNAKMSGKVEEIREVNGRWRVRIRVATGLSYLDDAKEFQR